MHFWPVYLYARFITPLIVWLRKAFRRQPEGRTLYVIDGDEFDDLETLDTPFDRIPENSRKLYVGPRFMPDTERVKFYPSLGDAMQAAGPNDTIVLRGKETYDRHAGQI